MIIGKKSQKISNENYTQLFTVFDFCKALIILLISRSCIDNASKRF